MTTPTLRERALAAHRAEVSRAARQAARERLDAKRLAARLDKQARETAAHGLRSALGIPWQPSAWHAHVGIAEAVPTGRGALTATWAATYEPEVEGFVLRVLGNGGSAFVLQAWVQPESGPDRWESVSDLADFGRVIEEFGWTWVPAWEDMTPAQQAAHLVYDHGFGDGEFDRSVEAAGPITQDRIERAWVQVDRDLVAAHQAAEESYPHPEARTFRHDSDHEGGDADQFRATLGVHRHRAQSGS